MQLNQLVNQITEKAQPKQKVSKVAAPKVVKEKAVAKAVKKQSLKPTQAFVIYFRSDRQKFIANNDLGRAEAARSTVEQCKKFIMKKYKVEATVLDLSI